MLRRAFSTFPHRTPSFLRSLKGDVVPYPKNATTRFDKLPVAHVGLDAVQQMLVESCHTDWLRNTAALNYMHARELFLREFRGQWLAVSSNRCCLMMSDREDRVRSIAEEYFRKKDDEDYYMGCLGSEVLPLVHMGGRVAPGDKPEEEVSSADKVYVEGEYSLDQGNSFHSQRMKFDTRASMMGVPKAVIAEHTLVRGNDVMYVNSDCHELPANTYVGAIIRVGGTAMTTPIVESPEWILGNSVLLHFITTVVAR